MRAGLGGQGRCEQRSEVVKNIKKMWGDSGRGGGGGGGGGGLWVGGGGGGVEWGGGGQGGCERRIEVFGKIHQKKFGGWGGGGGGGGGVRVDVNEELKFL